MEQWPSRRERLGEKTLHSRHINTEPARKMGRKRGQIQRASEETDRVNEHESWRKIRDININLPQNIEANLDFWAHFISLPPIHIHKFYQLTCKKSGLSLTLQTLWGQTDNK